MHLNSSKQIRLESLLDDKSFIRWIKDDADHQEKIKWDNWFNKKPENKSLAREAKKILNLPFRKAETPNVNEELSRLKDSISISDNQKKTPLDTSEN